MKITQLPEAFLSVIAENNGMQQYLENLTLGKEFTPRSWLYESVKDPDDILKNWLNILDRLKNGDNFEKNVYQFDTSQIEKWGPQGGVAPIDEILDEIVMPSFVGADSPQPKAFAQQTWKDAISLSELYFFERSIYGIRPASYKRVIDDMRARDTLESNSGWPDFTRRNKPTVVRHAIAAAENGEWENYPAIALFRNYNQKTRLVWMFPMAANVFEGSYMQPIQSAIMKKGLDASFFAPWTGFDAVRRLITQVYDSGLQIIATDFSSTDAHFQWSSTSQVADVLEELVQDSARDGIWRSLKRMHEIPLIIGPDKMIEGSHGVSSGSNWTNFVETVFDLTFAYYVENETNAKVEGLYAIGDDMCWVTDRYDEGNSKLLESLGSSVGQKVQASKASNEPDRVKTLQRLFQRGYRRPEDGLLRGVYSTVRALKSSVFPEKFHKPQFWSSDMFCARQYMILENCVDHPLFEEFVRFVVQGNEHLIPFAKQSRGQLDRIQKETKLLPGFNPTYNQEKRDSSLGEFASIAIARNL